MLTFRWENQTAGFRAHLLPPTPKGSRQVRNYQSHQEHHLVCQYTSNCFSRCDFYFSIGSVRAINICTHLSKFQTALLFLEEYITARAPVSCSFSFVEECLLSAPCLPAVKAAAACSHTGGQEITSALLPTEALESSSDCSLPAFVTLDARQKPQKTARKGAADLQGGHDPRSLAGSLSWEGLF